MTDSASVHSLSNDKLEEQYEEAGFAGRVGFGTKPAVLVIDFAKAWTDPASPLGSDLSSAVNETIRILDEARKKSVPVFFTTMAFEPDLSDVGQWVAKKKKHVANQIKGTKWVELIPELGRRPDEVLIVKPRASSFFGTPLLSQLIARNVDTLIITGCSTSGCVRATAQTSHDNNLRTIIPRQAVGDRSRSAHEANLFDMDARMGDVVDVDEVLDYLRAL